MRRCNVNLSAAYAAHGERNVTDGLASTNTQMPAWTMLTAIMLATIIFNFVWLG